MVRAVVLDLLVAPGQAEHRLVVEVHRHVLDRFERQAVLVGLVDQGAHVRLLPVRVAGQRGRVQLDAAHPDLRGEAQLLLGQFVELSDCNPDSRLRHGAFLSSQPFTDPAVIPATMKRWAMKYKIISGRDDNAAPAISGPQGSTSEVIR